jgi:malate dehydrogenase
MAKIGLVGFGGIGIEAAKALVLDSTFTCDIVAFDRPDALSQVPGPQVGAYEEILDTIGILQSGHTIQLTSQVKDLAGCDAIIFTAGLPRRADQTRADLIGVNVPIVGDLAKQIGEVAGGAFVVMVTNPLDAMVELAFRNLNLPETHVIGQAGVLDTGRFNIQAALAAGKPASQVDCVVMGGHGPEMVPIYSTAKVAYKPLTDLVPGDKLATITKEVRDRGRTIIQRQGRSATFSTAIAAIRMVKAYINDTREVMACCTRLNGEYGYNGIYGGVPTEISRAGAKAVEIPLTPSEKEAFDVSMKATKTMIDELDQFFNKG